MKVGVIELFLHRAGRMLFFGLLTVNINNLMALICRKICR